MSLHAAGHGSACSVRRRSGVPGRHGDAREHGAARSRRAPSSGLSGASRGEDPSNAARRARDPRGASRARRAARVRLGARGRRRPGQRAVRGQHLADPDPHAAGAHRGGEVDQALSPAGRPLRHHEHPGCARGRCPRAPSARRPACRRVASLQRQQRLRPRDRLPHARQLVQLLARAAGPPPAHALGDLLGHAGHPGAHDLGLALGVG